MKNLSREEKILLSISKKASIIYFTAVNTGYFLKRQILRIFVIPTGIVKGLMNHIRNNMRMWMLDPKFMCKKHIVGEHGEIHKFKKNFEKKFKIDNRMSPVVQILPAAMKKRHDELSKFMNHNSEYELPDLSYLPKKYLMSKVDIEYNIKDLSDRCPECKKLLSKPI